MIAVHRTTRIACTIAALLAIFAVAILGVVLGTPVLVLDALPIGVLVVLYGFAGYAFGVGGVLILWSALSAVGLGTHLPLWQAAIAAGAPLTLALWLYNKLTCGHLARVQRFLHGMRDGVVLADAGHTILLANPAAFNLLALPPDPAGQAARLEALGIRALWTACRETPQETLTRECVMPERIVQVTASPVYEGDSLMGFVTTAVDSSREQLAAHAREEFLALVSHELRNPLTSIYGFAELLANQPESTELAQFAQVILRNTSRLRRLIQDLLQLRSLEAGAFRLRRQEVDLVAFLQQVAIEMAPTARKAGISLEVNAPDTPVWGAYDPDRLAQILGNLLDNALKHTPRHGTIRLRLSTEPDAAVIEVQNSGTCIPAEELSRIFDKYYQTPTGQTVGHGAGLGLAICRELVGLHDGSIHATSDATCGTTFLVRLPRHLSMGRSLAPQVSPAGCMQD